MCGGCADNLGAADGGGLFITDAVEVSLVNTSVDANVALSRGGGILVQQRAVVNVSESRVAGNVAATGGGLHIALNGDVQLTSSEVRANRAVSGGGVLIDGARSELTRWAVTLGSLYGNVADVEGGTWCRVPRVLAAQRDLCVYVCVQVACWLEQAAWRTHRQRWWQGMLLLMAAARSWCWAESPRPVAPPQAP